MQPSSLSTISIQQLASDYAVKSKKRRSIKENLKQFNETRAKLDQVGTEILQYETALKKLESPMERMNGKIITSQGDDNMVLKEVLAAQKFLQDRLNAYVEAWTALSNKLVQLDVYRISPLDI